MTDVPEDDRLAALEVRVTGIEQALVQALAQFTPVGQRVAELSSAFLAANDRLAGLEAGLTQLAAAQPPPSEERLTALEQGQSTLDGRITAVEQARNRGGRLSSRLTNIEDQIQLLVDAQTGEPQE